MDLVVLMFVFCFILQCDCDTYSKKSTLREGKYYENPLPYFRRKKEEALDDPSAADQTENPRNIVTLFVQNLKEIFHDTYEDLYSKNNIFITTAKDDFISSSNRPTISEPLLSIEDKYNLYNSDFDDIMKKLTAKTEKKNQNVRMPYIVTQATKDNLIRHQKYKVFENFIQRALTKKTAEWIIPKTTSPSFVHKNQLHSFISASEGKHSDKHKIIETPKDFTHFVPKKERTTIFPLINQCLIDYSKGLKFCSYYLNDTDLALTSTVEMENPTSILFLGPKTKKQSTTVKLGVVEDIDIIDGLDNVTRLDVENISIENDKTEEKTQQSCIMCDNVAVRYCHAPKNKLIPSTLCEMPRAKCYSMHTPFGIVDRGCYNIEQNMSIYVCSCNLCNYIHHNEMPVMFKDKAEWAANVYEMTHHRRLRKSVHSDMACLKCEVNNTASQVELNYEAMNCLEGRVSSLPTQVCNKNEVCGVRALKNHGYIWRGCVNFPLYNYYLTLCDEDLCNYEPVVSIYEH